MNTKRPNPLAALEAENNRLKADARVLEAKVAQAQAEKACVVTELAAAQIELATGAADCSDPAKLRCDVKNASYDVLKATSILRDELCGSWRADFHKCDQTPAYVALVTLFEAVVLERDFELSVANHNAAFCASADCPNVIMEQSQILNDILAACPDMDARCRSKIRELLVVAGG